MSEQKKIQCPDCAADIDVNELLYQQIEKQIEQQHQAALKQQQEKLRKQQQALQAQQQQLESTIEKKLADSLEQEKQKLQEKITQQHALQISGMKTELDKQNKKLIELNKAQSEIEKLKREKQSLRAEVELAAEKKLTEKLNQQRAKLKQQVDEQAELKVAEKELLIKQLKDQLSEAQRKAEQGSVQIQGEVQELAIEEWLQGTFPLDTIEEIKKGSSGADTLQIINTHTHNDCGRIYYESKRTKNFSSAWIEKFKTDIQNKQADIGVLVTQAMPDGMQNLGQIDGVWICTFEEFKNIAQVLRHSLIEISHTIQTQENKGDKMEMLYNYLTGNEFRMQIESIVEGFTQLKNDLESEKRSMNSIWKKREKQIERVLLNTNFMYSSVKGIAGSAVQSIQLLELNGGDDNKNQ